MRPMYKSKLAARGVLLFLCILSMVIFVLGTVTTSVEPILNKITLWEG